MSVKLDPNKKLKTFLRAPFSKLKLAYTQRRRRRFGIVQRSPYENIYHCCTQKTASQWFRAVFSDPVVYSYTGLDPHLFTAWRKNLLDECFDDSLSLLGVSEHLYSGYSVSVPIPERTIGLTLYIGYQTYAMLPKPESCRAFFLMRDPRDIVVSWYFSTRYSHAPTSRFLLEFRSALEGLSFDEGLKYSMDRIQEFGLFVGQKSWAAIPQDEKDVKVFRYEDFALDNRGFLEELFAYLDIKMPDDKFEELCQRHKFEVYAGGRSRGTEDTGAHYRKGMPGDWQNYFDASLHSYFQQVTGDLLAVTGYLE